LGAIGCAELNTVFLIRTVVVHRAVS